MTEIGDAMQGIVNYLAAFFLSLAGGTVTGPTTFQQQVTAQGNVVIQNANILGDFALNGNERFSSGTKIISPADGTLQVIKSDGTFPTLVFGTAGNVATAVKFTFSNGQLTLQKGDSSGGVSLGSVGQVSFNSGGTLGGSSYQMGSSTPALVLSYTGGNSLATLTNGASNPGTGFLIQGQYTIAKSGNYTVLAADSGTHITNAGATGPTTDTLPTAQQGLRYVFTATAAQTLNITGAAGSINGPANLGKTTVSLTSQMSSVEVICYDGTNWEIRGTLGSTLTYS